MAIGEVAASQSCAKQEAPVFFWGVIDLYNRNALEAELLACPQAVTTVQDNIAASAKRLAQSVLSNVFEKRSPLELRHRRNHCGVRVLSKSRYRGQSDSALSVVWGIGFSSFTTRVVVAAVTTSTPTACSTPSARTP